MERIPRLPLLGAALALALSASSLRAQDAGSILGIVRDESSLMPLSAATVTIVEYSVTTKTEHDGGFQLPALPPGNVHLRIEHLGHAALVEQVTVAPGESTFMLFDLDPMVFLLDQLLVTSERNRELRDAASHQLEAAPRESAVSALDLLVARFPSLSVTGSDRSGGAEKRVRIRGDRSPFASNSPAVYIDGVRSDFTVLSNMSSTDVHTIRVLKGAAASSQYLDAGNGLILVETRRGKMPGG